MKRAALAAILLLVIAMPAFAHVGETRTWYSDSAFTNMVGKRYIPYVTNPCEDDYEYWYGQLGGAYKKIEYWNECYETDLDVTQCFEWDGSTYQQITCP